MDYAKSGTPKPGKNAPRFSGQNAKGPQKDLNAERAEKAALLARMKAAVEAKKQG